MSNRPQTPAQKKAFGVIGLISSVVAFASGISMFVTGKAIVRGHDGLVVTPENDPWQYWGIIAICFIAGAITLVASIRALIKASDDDTPSS
jgi:uncharacterized membrane protein YdcZ (DUF606 family)